MHSIDQHNGLHVVGLWGEKGLGLIYQKQLILSMGLVWQLFLQVLQGSIKKRHHYIFPYGVLMYGVCMTTSFCSVPIRLGHLYKRHQHRRAADGPQCPRL